MLNKAGVRIGLFAGLCLGTASAAFAQITQDVYVGNQGDGTVSIIDTASQSLISTIPGGNLPSGVAVTPDGRYAYVTNADDNTVSVIDTATQSVINTIIVGSVPFGQFGGPFGVAVTPDGRQAYVTNQGTFDVVVIDTATQKVTDIIGDEGASPFGVVVAPDGRHAYVTNFGDNAVGVIDTATQSVVNRIVVGAGPIGIAVTPDGRALYVANFLANTVSVIDTAKEALSNTIEVGNIPYLVAMTPDGRRVYVTHGANSVAVIDTATQSVLNTLTVGVGLSGVAVTPAGRYAYLSDSNENTVSVFDTARQKLLKSIPVGNTPLALGNFIGPNLITGTLGAESEAALTNLGFGQFMDFRGGTLQLKAPLSDAHTLSLLPPGGTIAVNHGFESTFSGSVTGSGAFTKTGAGTLSLNGTNSYRGGTNLKEGTLAVKNGGNLGTGPLNFHGATLEVLAEGGGVSLTNAIILQGGGGTFLADPGTTSTLSGVISGTTALTKDGPGTLILTGENTYSGGTNVRGGTIIVKSYRNLGSGPVRLEGGVIKVAP